MIFKKEKEVIKLIFKFLDEVENCFKLAEKAIQSYLKGKITKAKLAAKEVRDSESEADLIRYTIRDKLFSGAYLPVMREDIYKLVESIDKVANAAEAACDFLLNQRPSIPDELKSMFMEVAHKSIVTARPLRQAVSGYLKPENTDDETRKIVKAVGLKESTVDKIEWDLTKLIFISSLDYSHKLHLKLCLDSIVEISDRAEDAVDQLKLVSLKSVI